MAHYQELQSWSPTYGCEVARLSMADANGGEFYAILPIGEGASWRKLKQEALDVLSKAIEMGGEPGEYRWRRGGGEAR